MKKIVAQAAEDKNLLDEEQELFEHHRFEVDKGQQLLRIDKFLMHKLAHASRTKIQAAAEAGNIQVNSKTVKPSYKVKPQDLITILLPHPPKNFELIAENIPLKKDFLVTLVTRPRVCREGLPKTGHHSPISF